MKYYVVSDVHGYYSLLVKTLTEKGFFTDTEPHKLLVVGDLMDRGEEAVKMQEFILDLMKKDLVIIVRGNHEDLFLKMCKDDVGIPTRQHVHNGTHRTGMQLLHLDSLDPLDYYRFAQKCLETDYATKIITSTVDYFETEHYIFVHGWIPIINTPNCFKYRPDWRKATQAEWEKARWTNGMSVYSQVSEPGKTIVCGHYITSYGHCNIEKKCSEYGPDADFSPFYDRGIIAIDACTAYSNQMNCLVITEP